MPRPWYLLALMAGVAGIFALDMNTPLGVGVPFLYLLVVLLAIALRTSNGALLSIAALCTALTAGKLMVPQWAGVLAFGQSNRAIFVLLLWALLGLEFVRRSAALRQTNARLELEIAERRRAEQTINDYAKQLQGLASRLVEVQEVERRTLAEALHDRIGQNLSTLDINLHLLLARLPEASAALVKPQVDEALALLEGTTEVVRGVMEELHPALLEQYGLDVAVRWYGEAFSRRTGLAFSYEAGGLFPRLRERSETALFRIVQEALTNVAKHAGATQVRVGLQRSARGVELKIADDGGGMAPAAAASPAVGRGWGLALCRERARAIGAELQIETSGQGTTITVAVPNGQWEVDHDDNGSDR